MAKNVDRKLEYRDLFENNRRWARGVLQEDPDFVRRLSRQQTPRFLWIGCADSRVPANDLGAMADPEAIDKLCELNVLHQASNVGKTRIIQDAWRRQQPVSVHGWIYGLADGLIRDLECSASRADEVAPVHRRALERLITRGRT